MLSIHPASRCSDPFLSGSTAILFPGAGFDHIYLQRCFSSSFRQEHCTLVTPLSNPCNLIQEYWLQLDELYESLSCPIMIGGISIGALVTTHWALRHPDRVRGLIALLPPWCGDPSQAPAALMARTSAEYLRSYGLDSALEAMRSSSPLWLAEELTRSWTSQWPWLAHAFDEVAGYYGPTLEQLARLTIPVGIVGIYDDPLHPISVAYQWQEAISTSFLIEVSLSQVGDNPATLGMAGVSALYHAFPKTGQGGLSESLAT